MRFSDLGEANDVLDVSLQDAQLSDELRLLGELMAAANRCLGPRMPTLWVDLVLSAVGPHRAATVCAGRSRS